MQIKPEDHPSAEDSLSHVWLAGLKSGGENKAQSGLVERYKLDTEFFQGYVRHTRYVGRAKNRYEKVKEEWGNCRELGKEGFGVVRKQIREATGHYRTVKAINKRLPAKLDYLGSSS